MTLEERKRIVNLALVSAAVSNVRIHCHCYGSGSVSIPVVDKETREDLVRFRIDEDDTADSREYQDCETYLKELLKKGDGTNGSTKEDPERQTSEAAAAEPDSGGGA